MKYSKESTLKHSVSLNRTECLKAFNDLNIAEGYSGITDLFSSDVFVLDLDCVEAKIAADEHRIRRSSMDCTFAIEIEETDSYEMLMVELRYNYLNLQNLTRTKLLDKVSGSTLALGNSVIISNIFIFIFTTALKEQARSRLFRMIPRVPNNYVVMDIYELKAQYFS
jgi:hypothetical protein